MAEDAQALEKKDALFGKQEKEEGNDAEGDGEGVIVIDSVGRMEMLSRRARAIFGYGIGELEGSNVSSLMPQPFATAHGKYLRRFQKTGEARVLGMKRTVLGLHKDGTVFPVTIFISQVPDSEGQVSGSGREFAATTHCKERRIEEGWSKARVKREG